MIDYKNMNKLLDFLDVNFLLETHKSNAIGLEMASYMHDVVVNHQNQKFG
jgi:hypothetical protein